jgi:protein arginine N-methyltransferase 1
VSILDARDRFLKPGGWMIPTRETLWAALATVEPSRLLLDAWQTQFEFDFSRARLQAANQWRPLRLKPSHLLVEPRCWAELRYETLRTTNVAGTLSWQIGRSAIGHGISVWFDCETAPGAGFSNAPASEEHVFSQGFFPWPDPVSLSEGDEVRVELRADFDGNDYVWSWETWVTDPAAGEVRTHFRQSSFLAQSFGPDALRKRAHTFVPTAGDDARIDRRVLELMTGGAALGEIATRIFAEFPCRFRTWDAALTRVADLSDRYST